MATELEILEYAEACLRKLSLGINPLNDESLCKEDSCMQDQISRCLEYVADYLLKDIERKQHRIENQWKRAFINASLQDFSRYVFFEEPVSISKVVSRLNECISSGKGRFKYQDIVSLLIAEGALSQIEQPEGKHITIPTEFGLKVGFVKGVSHFYNVEREFTLCSRLGQQFVLSNIQKCIDFLNENIKANNSVRGIDEADGYEEKEAVNQRYFITQDIFKRFIQNMSPLSVSNFAKNLNEITAGNKNIRKIKYDEIRDWFVHEEYLKCTQNSEGKAFYMPTDKGMRIDVYLENRVGKSGVDYQVVMYGPDAQVKFLEWACK